jgi:hypothetical protein
MDKELALVMLSASVGMAGLLLVFLGFILSSYQLFPSNTYAKVIRDHAICAWLAILVFTLSIIDAILSLTWFLWSTIISPWLIIDLFITTIGGILAVAIATFLVLIRR